MRVVSVSFQALVLTVMLCGPSLAQHGQVPTHCKSGEFAYLNAKMSKVIEHKAGGYSLANTGNVLSICADRQKEPFQSVTYRYGPILNVEMERIASKANRFSIFSRSTTPHTGENLIFFKAGDYTYYVSEATGQGTGIGLTVFKSGRKVTDLFSGNSPGSDFDAGLIEIDFDAPASPVFKSAEPPAEL